MPYSRVRLLSAIAVACALPIQRALAQVEHASPSRGNQPPATPILDNVAPGAIPFPQFSVAPSAPGPHRGIPHRDLSEPFAAISAGARTLRDSLVALARAQIGRRYRFGGATPEHGFDCSGLVRYVMATLKIDLPRTAHEQAKSGQTVPRDTAALQPGDLLMFGSARHISHVGIYVGNGHFVQASSKAGRVVETPLIRPMVRGVKPWRAVRRVMPEFDADSMLVIPELNLPDVSVGAG
jgi:cell wall-associated NlpC family hydrolase